MEPLLIRLVIAALVIWLAQVLLEALAIKAPAKKIIFVIVVIAAVLYALGLSFFR
jgi:uncharacterized membrane protein